MGAFSTMGTFGLLENKLS